MSYLSRFLEFCNVYWQSVFSTLWMRNFPSFTFFQQGDWTTSQSGIFHCLTIIILEAFLTMLFLVQPMTPASELPGAAYQESDFQALFVPTESNSLKNLIFSLPHGLHTMLFCIASCRSSVFVWFIFSKLKKQFFTICYIKFLGPSYVY